MNLRRTLRTLAILALLATNVGCDQISKNIARENLKYYEEVAVANGYVTLIKVENPGAFLSLGRSLPQPVRVLLLSVIPLVVLGLAIIYMLTRTNLSNTSLAGISFIVGGGIGNVYDRMVHGSVTDFLHIDFVIFETGIFNLADVSIMTGVFMILFNAYFKRTLLKPEALDAEKR
jgi:signal peptidase II